MIKCDICGEKFPRGLKKCPVCGSDVNSQKEQSIGGKTNILILIALIFYSLTNLYFIITNFESFIDLLANISDIESFLHTLRSLGAIAQSLFGTLACWGIFVYLNKDIKVLKWISLILIISIPLWSVIDYILYMIIYEPGFSFSTLLLAIYYIIGNNPILLIYWLVVDKLKSSKDEPKSIE